jgi:hypothetical protein
MAVRTAGRKHRVAVVCPLARRGKSRDANLVPTCEHGRWLYDGGDRRRQKTRWLCPAGRCKPRVRRIAVDRFHPFIPRETTRFASLYQRRTAA